MRRPIFVLLPLALSLGCKEPPAPTLSMTPIRAGDGGFVRPAQDGGGLAHVVIDPMDPESLYRAAQESFLAGDFDKAADLQKKSLRLKPNAKGWHALGDTLLTQGRFGEAADAFEEAVTLDPTKRISWMRRGRCLMSAGRPKEAAAMFQRAFELKPDDAEALRDQADALLEAKDDVKAVEVLTRALALDAKGAAKDYKIIGESNARREKWAEAALALKESAKLHPDPGIFSELGEAQVRLGELDAARASFEEAAKLDPADPLAPETIGEIKLKQGDAAGARVAFEASLAAKDRPLPHLALGRLALKDGKKDVAKAHLDKAMAVVKGEDVSELRDIAQYAVEVDALDVADKLLVMVETDQAFPKDAGLFLLQAKVKQLAKDAKGVKVACDKARALLPKDDKTVCPPR